MAKLLHTADTHLGYRQYRLDERQQDFTNAFAEVISAAIDHDVDAVVHAGDLFHTSRPGVAALQTVLTELQRLQQADIPFLLIVGNHERTHDRNWVELLDEVGLATQLNSTGTRIDDTTIYGLDYVPPGQRDRLKYQFESTETDSAVLVGHGLFTPFPHGEWDSETILEKSPVDFDLMLVGDDHRAIYAYIGDSTSALESVEDGHDSEGDTVATSEPSAGIADKRVPISYAGSTERTMADQREPRTYSLVTVPADGNIDPTEHIDRREIQSTREFVYVDVPLQRGEGLETVKEEIREDIDSLDNAVLKITLEASEEAGSPSEDDSEMNDGSTSESENETPTHERVPEGPLENLGANLGALITRVSDRRAHFEDDREYETVEFADIDAAVQDRRQDMIVSEPADELLDVALNTDDYVDSSLSDTAEEAVGELLEANPLDTFHIDGEEGVSKADIPMADPDSVLFDEDEPGDIDPEQSPEDLLEKLTD